MSKLVKKIQGQTKCTCLKELINAELPGIKSEIKKNQYYLGQKRKRPVTWEEAERDYVEHYLRTWATGFKFAYCNYACKARDVCKIKER